MKLMKKGSESGAFMPSILILFSLFSYISKQLFIQRFQSRLNLVIFLHIHRNLIL